MLFIILEFIYDDVIYKLYNKFIYKRYKEDYWLFIEIIRGKALLFSFSVDVIILLDVIDLIFGLNPNLESDNILIFFVFNIRFKKSFNCLELFSLSKKLKVNCP